MEVIFMNIKKLLAGIGILGAVCGLVTGAKDWKEASDEEETEDLESIDVKIEDMEPYEEKEGTTEE
jgi:hypothetical protein